MTDFITQPWPWYVAGPVIGLIVPVLLIMGGRLFGLSANLRHLCAATLPGRVDFFKYDWKRAGLWNLTLVGGLLIGGVLASLFLIDSAAPVRISAETVADLEALGITNISGLVPSDIFSIDGLLSLPGLIMIVIGGFLVGFGARYAGGCTSGHAISGLADLQLPSLVAVIGFFVGGLLVTYVLLPFILA